MKSLGRKYDGPVMAGEKEDISYPQMRLEQKQMPSLKGCKVGDECTITIKAKIKGISQYGDGDICYDMELREGEMDEGEQDA